VNISEKLAALPDAEPFAGLPDAWRWSYGRFHFAAASSGDGRYAFETSCRDFVDDDLMRRALEFARERESEVLSAAPLAVVEGFSASGYRFDVLAVAMPAAHRAHQADDPELHAVTYAVYPAYRCEFSGLESQDEAFYRFEDDLDLAAFQRDPQPVVKVRYDNTKTGAGSVGDERGYTDLDYLISLLTDLADAGPDSFVEFENYRGEVWWVDWRDNGLVLRGGVTERPVELPELIEFVRDFICPETDT